MLSTLIERGFNLYEIMKNINNENSKMNKFLAIILFFYLIEAIKSTENVTKHSDECQIFMSQKLQVLLTDNGVIYFFYADYLVVLDGIRTMDSDSLFTVVHNDNFFVRHSGFSVLMGSSEKTEIIYKDALSTRFVYSILQFCDADPPYNKKSLWNRYVFHLENY